MYYFFITIICLIHYSGKYYKAKERKRSVFILIQDCVCAKPKLLNYFAICALF